MIGVAYPAISETKFFDGLLPLPPTNEQKRIVSKVDSLLSLCDRLAEELQEADSKRDKLFQAVVNHSPD
jgi:type I restriction enzyme S subunit